MLLEHDYDLDALTSPEEEWRMALGVITTTHQEFAAPDSGMPT